MSHPFSRRRPLLFAALPVILALAAPARADFLDDLFGSFESAPRWAPAAPRATPHRHRFSRRSFSIRLSEPRKEKKAIREAQSDPQDSAAGSKPQKPRLCAAPGGAPAHTDASTAYLRDETLRAGDSIVTESRIVVFTGRGACPHKAADFVSIARADLSRSRRNALAALEDAMRSPTSRFSLHAAKDAGPKILGQIRQ